MAYLSGADTDMQWNANDHKTLITLRLQSRLPESWRLRSDAEDTIFTITHTHHYHRVQHLYLSDVLDAILQLVCLNVRINVRL